MKDLELIQQGDVLIFKVDELPQDLKEQEKKGNRYILAEGEVTGHAHAITDDNVVVMADAEGNLFMDVKEEVAVNHEEHNTVTLEPGKYRVGRVVEADPFADLVREVRD